MSLLQKLGPRKLTLVLAQPTFRHDLEYAHPIINYFCIMNNTTQTNSFFKFLVFKYI